MLTFVCKVLSRYRDVKKARATVREKVIFTYKLVRCSLVTSEDKIFIPEDINRAEVEEKHSILRRNFKDSLLEHEPYIYYRTPLNAEADALSNKDNYVAEIHEQVDATTRLFNKYKKVLQEESVFSQRTG